MFREMRRKKQALSREECEAILREGTSGVLALAGDNGYPYAVPLSYVWDGQRLLFHSALAGHKLDAVARCDKASFCMIAQDEVVPEEYTTRYRSVIAFGRIRVIADDAEKRRTIEALSQRYRPLDALAGHAEVIDRQWGKFCMLEMTVEHLTGKMGSQLLKERENAASR